MQEMYIQEDSALHAVTLGYEFNFPMGNEGLEPLLPTEESGSNLCFFTVSEMCNKCPDLFRKETSFVMPAAFVAERTYSRLVNAIRD